MTTALNCRFFLRLGLFENLNDLALGVKISITKNQIKDGEEFICLVTGSLTGKQNLCDKVLARGDCALSTTLFVNTCDQSRSTNTTGVSTNSTGKSNAVVIPSTCLQHHAGEQWEKWNVIQCNTRHIDGQVSVGDTRSTSKFMAHDSDAGVDLVFRDGNRILSYFSLQVAQFK